MGNFPQEHGRIGNTDICFMMVASWRQDISAPIPKVITLDFTLILRYFDNESLEFYYIVIPVDFAESQGKIVNTDICSMMALSWQQDISAPIP